MIINDRDKLRMLRGVRDREIFLVCMSALAWVAYESGIAMVATVALTASMTFWALQLTGTVRMMRAIRQRTLGGDRDA